MLSHKFRTIFVHVPKTGGQSIEAVFLRRHGLTWEQRAPLLLRANADRARGPQRLAHLYASEYVALGHVGAADFAAYFKFGVVRNPWARAVSEFKFAHQPRGLSFSAFLETIVHRGDVERRHIVSQRSYLYSADGRLLVDRVLRFETLAEEFAEVSRQVFGRPEALPARNVAPDRTDYRTFYDEAGRELIAEKYGDDIATFGYQFDTGM